MSQAGELILGRSGLEGPVRRLLGSEAAEVGSWEVRPIGYAQFSPITGGICRVVGSALDRGETARWSLVLKVSRPVPQAFLQWITWELSLSSEEPAMILRETDWEREARAYATLLADLPGELRASRCFGIAAPEDDSRWIWLEDVSHGDPSRWSSDDFAIAARAIGTLNGAYLAGHPFPSQDGLSRSFLRMFSSLTPRGAVGRIRRPENWQLASVRRAFPVSVAERLLRLWESYPTLLDRLDRLPKTLCHHDAYRANLLRRASTSREVISVDWGNVGLGAVGEEAGQLLAASLLWNDADPVQAAELEDAIFEGYLDGRRDAGWRGDARLARLGYTAGVIRFCGTAAPLIVDNPSLIDSVERAWGPLGEFLDRWAVVRPYLLDLTDEARELMEVVF